MVGYIVLEGVQGLTRGHRVHVNAIYQIGDDEGVTITTDNRILAVTKSDQAPCDSWLVLCWFSFSRCVCNSPVSHCFYNLWYFQRPHEVSMMRQQKISLLELSLLVQTSGKLAGCLASSQEQHKASGTNSAKRDLRKTFLGQGVQRRQQTMRTVSL